MPHLAALPLGVVVAHVQVAARASNRVQVVERLIAERFARAALPEPVFEGSWWEIPPLMRGLRMFSQLSAANTFYQPEAGGFVPRAQFEFAVESDWKCRWEDLPSTGLLEPSPDKSETCRFWLDEVLACLRARVAEPVTVRPGMPPQSAALADLIQSHQSILWPPGPASEPSRREGPGPVARLIDRLLVRPD